MKDNALKGYLLTFLVGGIIGVVAQLFLTIYSYLGIGNAVLLMVFSIATLGAILTNLDLYQKLLAIAGMGAGMPISGLSASITGEIIEQRSQGASMGKAVKKGLTEPIIIIGAGYVIAFIIALISFYISA